MLNKLLNYSMSETANPEQIKKFTFSSNYAVGRGLPDNLDILIPEQLQASYSFYTWPSSPILAWFLWENRIELPNKHILELGAGTALPSIVAAKCGAHVTVTESSLLPKSIQHIKHSCQLNGLGNNRVRVLGITWGLFLSNLFKLGSIDLIIASDCFYDPNVFEDIIVTVSFLLDRNVNAKFLTVYQERSSDWSIEYLLNKWNLKCENIDLSSLGLQSGINVQDLMQDHTLHLLKITRK
ncbi:hypothetical protein M8J77_014119 [Diaphorina citri]|nr:hypothetical protein M8J77_014119 [Diaphorina citri]